jgi:hypothetical protein
MMCQTELMRCNISVQNSARIDIFSKPNNSAMVETKSSRREKSRMAKFSTLRNTHFFD